MTGFSEQEKSAVAHTATAKSVKILFIIDDILVINSFYLYKITTI